MRSYTVRHGPRGEEQSNMTSKLMMIDDEAGMAKVVGLTAQKLGLTSAPLLIQEARWSSLSSFIPTSSFWT